MAYPARFVAIKPPQQAYEQRLKDAGEHREETIASLLEEAGMDVEGSDATILNEEVEAAATALEDFIYERQVGRGRAGAKAGEEAEEKVEERTEGKSEENEAATGEKATTAELNGETAQAGADQEMKEGPTDA